MGGDDTIVEPLGVGATEGAGAEDAIAGADPTGEDVAGALGATPGDG